MSGQNWLKPKVPNFAGYLETRSPRGKVPNFNVQPHVIKLSQGGVVLLSPAAPSYGYYRDYIERGCDFAAKAGLSGT